MVNPRVLMMAGICLCAALGYALQLGPKTTGEPAQDLAVQQALPAEPLELENIALTSATAAIPAVEDDTVAPLEQNCTFHVTSEARPDAMVQLDVKAPCEPNARVNIHHSGMLFSARLDDAGHLKIDIPALKASGIFIVESDAGQTDVILQPVIGLDLVERVALQWTGHSGFELHAREFGAAYGSEGHIWHRNTDGLGRIYQLGDSSLLTPDLVEIYSVPQQDSSGVGDIALTVEAEITALNCNRSISAQLLNLRGGVLTTRDLVLDMPSCEATGDFLVLNNLVENLTIAQN